MARTYKGRTFVRETAYICGDYMDVDVYPVYQRPGKRRQKSKPTREIQRKLNQRNRERAFRRLLLLNFSEKDLYLTLSYAQEPESREAAQRALAAYLRRVKRRREKAGLAPLRYMACTVGGLAGTRTHHHLILSGDLSREELEDLWGLGYANTRRLRLDQDGAEGLSRYITRQKTASYRKWTSSRNLQRPEPQQRDGAISPRELGDLAAEADRGSWDRLEARFPGWEIIGARAEYNPVNGGVYVRLELKRRRDGGYPERGPRKKEGRG